MKYFAVSPKSPEGWLIALSVLRMSSPSDDGLKRAASRTTVTANPAAESHDRPTDAAGAAPVALSSDAPVRSTSIMTRDFEANSQAAMFGYELWDCGTKVFAQANRGIRFQRRIGKLLQTVSEAHLECAKKINKAVERAEACMANYSHPSMTSSIEGFQGLMGAMHALTLAQNTFAAQSESNCRHIFNSFSSLEAEIKQLERQHAHLERDMKAATAAHSESRKKFHDAVSKHKDFKESDKSSSDPKFSVKIAEKEREAKRRESEYKAATESLNEVRDITNGHSLPSLLKAIYCVEEMRIQTMRQSINQFGCLVRNQKIPFKQIGDQIVAASHIMKPMDDLKLYMEAVATNLPAPSDEPVETYDTSTCKLSHVEMDPSPEGGSPAMRDPASRELHSVADAAGLLKGLKSMFSGLRKKTESSFERPMLSTADSAAAAHRRASKITTKRFYGLAIENHLTRKYRGHAVPLVAAFLMDAVLEMDGSSTQGIFRLSAPSGEMAAARNQIEVCLVFIYCYALDPYFCCRLMVLRVMKSFKRPEALLATALSLPYFSKLGSGSYLIPLFLRLRILCLHHFKAHI